MSSALIRRALSERLARAAGRWPRGWFGREAASEASSLTPPTRIPQQGLDAGRASEGSIEPEISETGVRRYTLRIGDHDYKVRVDPNAERSPLGYTRVDFARRGADDSAITTATGDAAPREALGVMRRITEVLQEDARRYGARAYDWVGASEGHDSLYRSMLSRYGAPEGYYLAEETPRVRQWPSFGEANPAVNALDGGAASGGRVRAYRGRVAPHDDGNGVRFWTDDAEVANANAYGEGGNVSVADLDLGRNLEIDAGGRMWDDLDPAGIPDEAVRKEFSQRIHTMDPSQPVGGYGWFDVLTTDRLAQIARRHGYDSVTFRGVVEGGSDGRPVTSYAVVGDRANPGSQRPNGSPARSALAEANAARLARAREQGFDTDSVLFHGTRADFDAFRPADHGAWGPGAYLTRDAERASDIASNFGGVTDAEGANVIPVFVRRGKGRPSAFRREDVRVENPADIRSIFANFDPAQRDSANLLAGLAVAAPVGAMSLREALLRMSEQGGV